MEADLALVTLASFDARLAMGIHLCREKKHNKAHKGLLVCNSMAQKLDTGSGSPILNFALSSRPFVSRRTRMAQRMTHWAG